MSRREQLQTMLEEDPDDLFLHYALAMEFVAESAIEEALGKFQDVIARDPDYAAAYFQIGQLLAGREDYDGARDSLQQGIAAAQKQGDRHAVDEMTGFLETLPD